MLRLLFVSLWNLPLQVLADRNVSSVDLVPPEISLFDDRPKGCPPCFNCNLDDFQCKQYAPCNKNTGRCECPPGFGGDDCLRPLCGSLADPNKDRPIRPRKAPLHCNCKNGWEGINCNVCSDDKVCNSFTPEGRGGVCHTGDLVVKQNFQMCNVTNQKILDQPGFGFPQVTFSCNAERKECKFQFWVDELEAFYCGLDKCSSKMNTESNRNITRYDCEEMRCSCVKNRALCGKNGMIDITDFLEESIRGPAYFETRSTGGGSKGDGSIFSEPEMDNLINQVFADSYITLKCKAGECMHRSEVPGYTKPPPTKINTPAIAGVIAGCALFVAACILLVWFLTSRTARRRYGPIHLSDDEDEDLNKILADHKPAALHFEEVSYSLNGKQILSSVQGRVKPGEILAIMGASGAGKTTFLDILARKNKRGSSSGSFYVNGEKVYDDDFRSIIGFVDQDDTMLPTLTVHETILDSALLRLPKHMPRAAKEQRVEEVERQLGIYTIREQIIGSEEGNGRGISGGEKRRVGIACELVTSPSILFLDEPTSGLDSFNAYNVVECLVNLVKTYNRTVVFSIHQPRSNIVALFDQLILLAEGKAVYSGPFSDCQAYFDSIGYSCPLGFNIADYLVDLTKHAGMSRSPMDDIIEAEARNQTRSSSAMAIKSLASISNLSNTQSVQESPATESPLRPKAGRRTSVKQQQEQNLFARKKSSTVGGADTPATTRSDEESPIADDARETPHAWVRLSKQSGQPPPPQSLDESHQLPPDINVEGTDLDHIVESYASSDVAAAVQEDIKNAIASADSSNGRNSNGEITPTRETTPTRLTGYRKVGILGQFLILSRRTWRNLYRNPMLMLTHYAISIVVAVLVGFLFYGVTNDIGGVQNRLGLLFFILALFGFGTLTSLTVFATERLIFVRERAKGYYSPISYFSAKVFFDIVPLRLIPPIILAIIVYPMTGLVPSWPHFFKFLVYLVLFNFAASAICLFIGIIFKNGGLANLIGSLVMLFSLLFAGFLLNHQKIPRAAVWLQTLSIFHYAFEGMIVNELVSLTLIEHKFGIDIEVPGGAILSTFGFDAQAMAADFAGLVVFCAVFILLGYGAMHVLLVERR